MYLKFLWSLLRHKWFVFVECCRLGIPWLGLIHDWSKFTPQEFVPYAQHFKPTGGSPVDGVRDISMDYAWLHHQHRNKHHWQRWITHVQGQAPVALPMPDRYRREMLADWRGWAYGNPDTAAWYAKNRTSIILHPETREWVELELLCVSRLTPVVGDAASSPDSGEQTRTSRLAGEGSAPHPPRA